MLFATNRALVEGPTPIDRQSRTFQFPRDVTFNLASDEAGQSIYFCQRTAKDKYQEIGNEQFFESLAAEPATDIVFYIHGYSNLPEPSIFPRTEELQQLFDRDPSQKVLVVPLIWPCDNDEGPVLDYFDDQMAADASAMAFTRFFEKFFAWMEKRAQDDSVEVPFEKNLHVLTHSMGARVLAGALNYAIRYFQFNGFPLIFKNIFLSAPDLASDALEANQIGQWIPASARNVVVYYASDDLALVASRGLNLANFVASRRLGQKGPENFSRVASNVFALDCDGFNNTYELVGHSYFAGDNDQQPGLLFQHMQATIDSGQVKIPAGLQNAVLTATVLA